MKAHSDHCSSESDDRSVSSSSVNTSSKGDMSTSNATSMSGQELLEEKERMFQNETKHVRRLKLLVLAIMIVAAIVVSTVVYFTMENAEEDQFESHFEASAAKLLCKSPC
jgi:hypothetical protein